jgi:hypothetical protein
MWQVIESALGSVIAAVIIGVLGLGGTTVIISSASGSHNPRKKWRVLMVASVIVGLPTYILSTTYVGGVAHTASFGGAIVWVCIAGFVCGWIGNWVNK